MAGEQILTNRPLFGARLNMAHPLTKGLVGCWLLNEQAGLRAMDLSPYANHGVLTSFPPFYQRPFNGLPFDGLDDVIFCGSSPTLLSFSKGIAYEAWVSPAVVNAYLGIASNGADAATWANHTATLRIINTGVASFVLDIGTGAAVQNGVTTLIADRIHHIIGTYDLQINSLFLDGKLDKSGAYTGAFVTGSGPFRIGEYRDGFNFNGRIFLVRVWNCRALTAQDVKNLYLNPYEMFLRPED